MDRQGRLELNHWSTSKRKELLKLLNVPENSVPAQSWLTEFEVHWPYEKRPGRRLFLSGSDSEYRQTRSHHHYTPPPWSTDGLVYAIAAALVCLPCCNAGGAGGRMQAGASKLGCKAMADSAGTDLP